MENKTVSAILDKHEDFIRRHLMLTTPFIEKMRKHDVITYVTKRKILSESKRANQVTALLYMLRRRNIQVFHKFLKLLWQSLDRWIAEVILDTDATGLVDIDLRPTEKTLRDYFDRVYSSIDIFLFNSPKTTSERKRTSPETAESATSIDNVIVSDKMTRNNYHLNPKMRVLDVPRKVQSLYSVFENQRITNENSLIGLKQEELAIKDILSRNIKKQKHIRKNQDAIADINRRLQHINFDVGQLLQPMPYVTPSRHRMRSIQNIHWIDRPLHDIEWVDRDHYTTYRG